MIQPGLPPTVPPPPAPVTKPAATQQTTSIRDTIESILVAFILAFIFRAFVVEAFVIPTGSMAPTLLGAHMRFHCPDCGYKFTANYSSQRQGGDDVYVPNHAEPVPGPSGAPEARVYPIHCPNCGFKLSKNDPLNVDNDATSPPVHHGDRILVMKYLYLFGEPARWDVVVFKSPDRPDQYDYTQNYIKRLVGKPNEVILILDGDIYVAPNTGGNAPAAGDFKVQTKPKDVQDALWRVVYDNDFHPTGNLGRSRTWQQPWTPTDGQGWAQDANGGRTFAFDNLSGAGTLRFDPAAMPETFPFKDFTGYDQTYWPEQLPPRGDLYNNKLHEPQNVVSDLKLGVTYRRDAGDGPLSLRLSKGPDVFTAELSVDKVRLLRATGGAAPTVVGEASARFDRLTRVELQNVDYRVSVFIDGNEVLATGADYAPDVALLREVAMLRDAQRARQRPFPTAEIVADRQQCTIRHIGLHRDIYYTEMTPSEPHLLSHSWGSPRNPIHLGPDEYFVCGDNSLISGDARAWGRPINLPYEHLFVDSGRVPGRFMLGKAFFVYWPAGYRPLPNLPGLAPNFGEMRFIH